jgi:DNA-binding phage protein
VLIIETPEEMAAYLKACIQESEGDYAFIAKAVPISVVVPSRCMV